MIEMHPGGSGTEAWPRQQPPDAPRRHVLTRPVRDRVVVVTGASAGIGRAIATRLARRGAKVVGCARDPDRLQAFADATPGVLAVRADVTSAADREELLDTAVRAHGRVDVLVNNAGRGWAGLVEDMPPEKVREVIETNLLAVVELTRLALPGMLARRDGDVLMVSSGATWFTLPPLTVYGATKHGVDGFVRSLRKEVWARGVRVHSVNPGPVRTEWLARSEDHQPPEGHGEEVLSPGISPEWVAAAVERSLRRPWPRTASVPRVVGLGRLLEVPPVSTTLDWVLSRNAPAMAASGQRLAREKASGRAQAPTQ